MVSKCTLGGRTAGGAASPITTKETCGLKAIDWSVSGSHGGSAPKKTMKTASVRVVVAGGGGIAAVGEGAEDTGDDMVDFAGRLVKQMYRAA